MSFERFIRIADSLVEFEAAFNDNKLPVSTVFSIEIHKDEVKSIWSQLKSAYEVCVSHLQNSEEGDKDETADIRTMKQKYENSYITYSRCISNLNELSHGLNSKSSVTVASRGNNVALPPCEIKIFDGDYASWPTFRDLFTAVCIKNGRLSNIERLFYLIQKTKGEANDIVSKSPLTNDGFQSAWANLSARYENMRMLVNLQLKTLFNLQSITSESGSSIKTLQRDLNACISSLQLYNIDVKSWDPIFVFIVCQRLPEITLTLWEQTVTNKAVLPKWSDLDSFLTNRYRTLESVSEIRVDLKQSPSKPKSLNKGKDSTKNVHTFQSQVSANKCHLCPNDSHIIRKCPRFLKMSQSQRLAEIRKNNLCLNCFSSVHSVRNCKSKYSCFRCSKRHNTLLHIESTAAPTSTQASPSTGSTTTETTPNLNYSSAPFIPQHNSNTLQSTVPSNGVQTYFSSSTKSVLLGTAVVNVCHAGIRYTVRALLDSGSEATFISEKLFNLIKLPSRKISAKICGLNNSISADSQRQCTFLLGSAVDDAVQIQATAFVVPQLSGNLPSRPVNLDNLCNLPEIKLADPKFHECSKIDILLGGDLLPLIMLSGLKKGVCESLMAQQTVFGWILTGPVAFTSSPSCSTSVSYHCKISLDKEISRFWEVEDFPRKHFLSESEQICEELYSRTTTRSENGQYVVSLPFREDYPDKLSLGQSRASTMAQFFRNEARLIKNPELKKEYDDVLQEYLTLGHMSPVSPPNISETSPHYYLPHHAVYKPESTTTKVRVVFNASSPTSNGQSLNDILYTGPVLQNDLTVLIVKWRFFRYVFNGDLQKMYRQILVNPDHRVYQKILYRTNPANPLQHFQLNTVTFGVNCAPYLAIRTIIQLANDIQDEYPLAGHILRHCMYVDDALAGAHTIPTAIKARDELIHALSSAGFTMRKWTSNSKDILANIPLEDLLYEDFLDLDDHSSAKTLGIRWNACSDSFYFSITPFPDYCKYTKREVLSQISKLFDPAGWLAPIVIRAKIIMQKVWSDKTEWDEVLVEDTLHMWKLFQSSYHHINSIQIPRWVDFTPDCDVEFHGFSDASEKAYAAAVYLRISKGNITSTHLIMSKTKVAPIKTVSIPRLELCGAVLLTDIIDSLLPQLEIQHYQLFCWTDSTIVLSWLAKPPCTWNTFVANRISKIIQVIDPTKWQHVKSEQNPADLASRGVLPQELVKNHLWWHGPEWLSDPSIQQPHISEIQENETDLEKKSIKVNFTYFSNHDDILERFSALPRALRVIAYVFRFLYSTHPSYRVNFHQESQIISSSEIRQAQNKLIVMTQKASYPKEYMLLSNGKSIQNSSPLLNLYPFIDSEGMMRISGRLEHSPVLSYNEKHPILLPYSCQYSRLLVQFIHQISLHGGNQLVLRLLRTNYWIPKVQNLIKSTIRNCKPCVLYKRKCQKQLMSTLPPERCDISRPFTRTGLDFAGPFEIKTYAGRSCRITKGYVCIFVCFSTKAIHLEATSDLSTTVFLAAFGRFVSRRGCPLHLHSDNGQTFVGASRTIAKEFVQTSRQVVSAEYSLQNIQWHFIPPAAPHMGGLWEAGVKSLKQHLRKTAGVSKYTFEEFQTLLSKIEACLNSRPISPMSDDPSDIQALTPGHFLVGSPILVPIDPNLSEAPITINNRWQRLNAIHQQFCNRWKNEYLKELHKRNKWKHPERNLKEDMLVIIKEENLPPNCWRLGRITKVYPGSDNLVRIAEVLTQKGTLVRPVTKLIHLPTESS